MWRPFEKGEVSLLRTKARELEDNGFLVIGERQEGGNKRQEWTLYKTKFAISKEYLTEKYNYIKE